jgi:host factor-I protein
VTQDQFLESLKGQEVHIFLVNGIKLVGKLGVIDTYCVILEGGKGPQLIFKHAISTIGRA